MPSYYNNRAVRPSPDDEYEEELPRQATGSLPTYRVAGSVGPITRPARRPVEVPQERPEMEEVAPALPRRTTMAPARRPNVPQYTRSTQPRTERTSLPGSSKLRLGLVVLGVLAVLVVSYLVVSAVVTGWQNWQDDQAFGRPRLTRLEAKVGHNETSPTSKTLFVAQNLHGQISIIEIPGEDPTQTRVIVGPQLFGKDRDLVPIKLTVQDINGDGQPDLIATVQEQKLIYINEKGSFRPITDAERSKLQAQAGT